MKNQKILAELALAANGLKMFVKLAEGVDLAIEKLGAINAEVLGEDIKNAQIVNNSVNSSNLI